MKNLIFAILFLSALTAWFSFRGEIVPLERTQKEGWAFFGGMFGEPVPSEGADGKSNVFTINAKEVAQPEAEQIATAQPAPISVSVEQQPKENAATWEMFFMGVAAGVLIAEVVATVMILWLISHERRKHHEKRKSWTRQAHRLP